MNGVYILSSDNRNSKLAVLAEINNMDSHFKEEIKKNLYSILLKRLNPDAYKSLGIAYRNLNKYDKAIMALEKAKNLTPFDWQIHSELGICYLAKGNFCKSSKELIQAIKLNPDNTDIQIQLALVHEAMGEIEMAFAIYQKIIETNPECLKAYVQKTALYLQEENFIEAKNLFRIIIRNFPEYNRAYLGMAICCDKLGNKDKAKRFYKKYLQLTPDAINSQNVQERISTISFCQNNTKNFLKIVN